MSNLRDFNWYAGYNDRIIIDVIKKMPFNWFDAMFYVHV